MISGETSWQFQRSTMFRRNYAFCSALPLLIATCISLLPRSLASNGICAVTMYQYRYIGSYRLATGVSYSTQYYTYSCGWGYCKGSRSVSSTYYYIQPYDVLTTHSYTGYQCCAGYTGNPYSTCYPVCTPSCWQGSCTSPNVCTCYSGWSGASCSEDINECQTNNGGCAQLCTNSPGTYACSCRQGYYLDSDGLHCSDINECTSYNGRCQHTCHNVIGSYYCSCVDGYLLSNDSHTCDDIDECVVGNGGCDHICTNQVGSYDCSCQEGYKIAYDLHRCVDLPILLASAHSTSISIQWTVNTTMEEYQIVHTYLGPCPITNSSGTASVSGNSTSYTIFDIYGFSIYNITLAGLKDGIWYQSSVQISTLSAVPVGFPSNITPYEWDPTFLTVYWSEVQCDLQRSEIASYRVKYGTLLGNKTTVETEDMRFTAVGLVPYTDYSFEVAAVNRQGISGPFSPPLIIKTPLGIPTIVKEQTLSPTSVLLTWLPSDGDGLTTYTILYAYEGRCSEFISNSQETKVVTSTNCTIDGLEEFSTYSMTVMAMRGTQVTQSNCTVMTPSAAPSAPPASLVNTSSTSTTVALAWDQVPCIHQNGNISGYIICYGTMGTNWTTKCDSIFVTTYTATGLDPYTIYAFKVAAMNSDNKTGPYSEPTMVKTYQPFPPYVDIIASPSIPIDGKNCSLTCKVYIPTEALGKVIIKWFGFLNNSTAINSTVIPNVAGANLNFDLIFSPIRTRDGGWYSCEVTYELYPIGSIKKIKFNVESDAIFQVKIGPVTNCIHLWPLAEYNDPIFGKNNDTELESIQSALFMTIEGVLKDHHCPCMPKSIDWVISCEFNSPEVVFKYFLHLGSEHCSCSATEVLLALEKWVDASGTVEMGRFRMHVNSTCQPVRLESLEGFDCLNKKLTPVT